MNANWEDGGLKTLLFLYYAGYGSTKDYTYAMCDMGGSPSEILYPLEQQLRVIAELNGAYVVGIFDTCQDAAADRLLCENKESDSFRNSLVIFGETYEQKTDDPQNFNKLKEKF